MKYAVIDQNGRVVAAGDSGPDPAPPHAGTVIDTGDVVLQPDAFYHHGGRFHQVPEPPGPLHTFCYETRQWLPPDEGVLAAVARAQRGRLLADDDWVTLRAYDRGEPVPQEWREYFQALRDITEQAGFPFEIEWPQRPGSGNI